MSVSELQTSRVFTVSLPEYLAAQVEELVQTENRDVNELFREAFDTYCFERLQRRLGEIRAAAAARPGPRYTEDDVEDLVDEIRTELSAKRAVQ